MAGAQYWPATLWRNSEPYQKTTDLYVIQRNRDDPEKWDVVRNTPTVISVALEQVGAETLAFALNDVRTIEEKEV